ncbi:MAG: UDP-N-acetylglucosamine 2-epimerase (non-hydrolyzing) [Eubacteriales bacterium]|nr:UDP-N-acetylglucosamine 2-epimerase (non-hydrolyzing) [Eubacteriales bacterium]
MKKIKIMTVFGTRPEAIKMAPLALELKANPNIDDIVCVTAQHREMLDQVLDIFNLNPDFDLNIMQSRQTLATITTKALEGLDGVIKEAKPDMILVHGDTSTTFVGALAAFYNQVPVGHVEAGLRTYDKYSPFPEEMNRKLTGQIAELHFSPTVNNKNNLLRENISEDNIFITGNTVIDALKTTVDKNYTLCDSMKNVDFEGKRVILLTAHRRENLGMPLRNIFNAIRRIINDFPDVEVVYPMHMNPAVREPAREILGDLPRVRLIEPVDVRDLHNAMDRCFFVMTDSGGIQEEAPSLGKPVLVLRNETERPEAVAAGTVKIAGVDEENIYSLAHQLLTDENEYAKMSHAVNPYGDGFASKRTVEAILYHFGLGKRPSDFIIT